MTADLIFVETSAKDGTNVEQAFTEVAREIYQTCGGMPKNQVRCCSLNSAICRTLTPVMASSHCRRVASALVQNQPPRRRAAAKATMEGSPKRRHCILRRANAVDKGEWPDSRGSKRSSRMGRAKQAANGTTR